MQLIKGGYHGKKKNLNYLSLSISFEHITPTNPTWDFNKTLSKNWSVGMVTAAILKIKKFCKYLKISIIKHDNLVFFSICTTNWPWIEEKD